MKFLQFLKNLFFKDAWIKFIALVLAVFVVMCISIA